MPSRILSVFLILVGFGLIGAAFAAPAPDAGSDAASSPDANIVDQADRDPVSVGVGAVENARKGNWKLALAGVLSLVIYALKKLKAVSKIFESVRGGAIFVLATGLLGFFAMTLGAGGGLGFTTILAGFITTLIAAGGWELVVKRLILGRA